jgi:N-hydroxyarylamine O-acetyltransferase
VDSSSPAADRTQPRLESYLTRIDYLGERTPTLETLREVHRAHLRAIPYENLDIHFGRRLELGVGPAFRKLVLERRGGWCYEMNGLFAWALGELGFDVRLVAGTVGRAARGDRFEGNHLVLVVRLDRDYLADVGFGDGPLDPLPLAEGEYRVGWLDFRLERSDGRWVFHNHRYGGAPSFDFTLEPRSLESFGPRCADLQTSPESGFVQKTVCQRYDGDDIVTLRGAVLRRYAGSGVSERVVADAADYVAVLERDFGLRLPQAAGLWPAVRARHVAWVESERRENP